MKILLLISFISTLIALLLLMVGFIINLKTNVRPKKKAFLGVVICLFMAIYLGALCITSFWGLLKQNYAYLVLVLFIIFPFILGHFASYEKRKLYTIFQMVSYIASMVILHLLYIFC